MSSHFPLFTCLAGPALDHSVNLTSTNPLWDNIRVSMPLCTCSINAHSLSNFLVLGALCLFIYMFSYICNFFFIFTSLHYTVLGVLKQINNKWVQATSSTPKELPEWRAKAADKQITNACQNDREETLIQPDSWLTKELKMKWHQLKINMKFYRQPLQRNQGRHNMISAAHSQGDRITPSCSTS